MREVLNVEEAAEYLRMHPADLRRLARRGDIPARKVGRQWRFSRRAIDAWLAGADDEPLSPDDLGAVRRGLEDVKAGRVKSLERYEAERGLGPAR